MKKLLLFSVALLGVSNAFSQELNTNEAVLFSQNNISGTARYQAMSGAFGALGGDLSALSVNPAGSTVFANNQLGISITNSSLKNTTSYLGTDFKTGKNNLTINQLGGVFVFKDTTRSSKWKKISVAMTYDSNNRFNNDILAVGTNYNNSIGDYFTAIANGSNIPLDELELRSGETHQGRYRDLGDLYGYNGQLSYLGYNAFLLSPVSNNINETSYMSNAAQGNYKQEKSIVSRGEYGKITANLAGQYQDFLSIGINLNNHFVTYERAYKFIETNSNTTQNGFNRAEFETNISTVGSGFSFNLGLLAKIKNIRLGAAFESSTWYTFSEETSHYINFNAVDNSSSISGEIDPNTTNIYPSYKYQSPNKTTLSFAYVFGKKGLISIDYGRKCYSKIKYKPGNDYRSINAAIEQNLKNTSDIRVGAEYRIKQISLRGGANFQESPYESKVGVGNYYQASAGAGYTWRRTTIDIAYSRSVQAYSEQMYSVGLTDKYQTYAHLSNIVCSLLFEL